MAPMFKIEVIMDYEQKYKEALETARKINSGEGVAAPPDWTICEVIFPELKDSKNEIVRKSIIHLVKKSQEQGGYALHKDEADKMLAWLEKQGDTNETINNDKFAQDVLRGAAINLITWIDYNAAEGNVCLSNTECKDITDALVKGDWDKIYAYIKKKLEKQGQLPKKVPIWKHWKDGIAGNGDGKQIYLTKTCNIYNISSCLGCECDYIELSELDDLLCNKQSEQKPADKIEPKFHKGDWIVNKLGDSWHIDSFDKKYYQVSDGKGNYNYFPITKQDEMHLWTIQDANDGDVLVSYHEQPFIYNGNYDSFCVGAHCGIDCFGAVFITDECDRDWTGNKDIHPATKKQRDLLFKKMHKAGYEWDAKKKELKKLKQ